MNIRTLIACILTFTALGILSFIFLRAPRSLEPQIRSDDPTAEVPPESTANTLLIKDAQDKQQTVSNFIQNGTTLTDPSNKGRYLLAGDLGICVTDQKQCQAGPAVPFNIFYDESSQSFIIGISDEPLGSNRARAEQTLRAILGISQDNMCRLRYYIGTTEYVNPSYAGQNLGFSFCPGATQLPK